MLVILPSFNIKALIKKTKLFLPNEELLLLTFCHQKTKEKQQILMNIHQDFVTFSVAESVPLQYFSK